MELSKGSCFKKSCTWCTFWLHLALCHQNVIRGVLYSSRKTCFFSTSVFRQYIHLELFAHQS